MTSKGILITGGAGFIGSSCISFLNQQGFNEIYISDQLGLDEKWKNLRGKQFKQFIPKDRLFEWLTPCRLDDLSAVLHLGACSSTTEKNADFLIENNTLFSQRLAQVTIEKNLRFVYASSAATYGLAEKGFSDDHAQLKDLLPQNMYGFSKHLFDLWMDEQGYLDCAFGLKYFNIFGPNEWHKGSMSSHVLSMLPQVFGGEVRLFKSNSSEYEDGEQKRDFLYSKDAAAMTCYFLTEDTAMDNPGIYNIGSGVASSWNSLAHWTMKAADKQVPIEYVDMPENLEKHYQNYTCADMQKYFKLAGAPKIEYSLEAAVRDYVQNHLLETIYY